MASRSSRFQEVVQRVPVPDHIYDLAVDLVRRTRPRDGAGAGMDQEMGHLGRRAARGAIS